MDFNPILNKVLNNQDIRLDEAMKLYRFLPTSELMLLAHNIRMRIKPSEEVTWIIDRNVNISNVCMSGCDFCSFYCHSQNDKSAFVTTEEEYKQKIEALFQIGGRQLLLQGGMHPDFKLSYYENLFIKLKSTFPKLKLHALGPPEIHYLSDLEGIQVSKVLERLIKAGLDSLPGAGAEILCDSIRKKVSPRKCTSLQWLNVMKEAHKLNIPTTATMMFGHVESLKDRLIHLFKIKKLQSEKPQTSLGFTAFIPWTFQSHNTLLKEKFPLLQKPTVDDYIRTIAISRIVLQNIPNIQASWLTAGFDTAKIALWAGANDLGSIMIEENVVAASGVIHKLDADGMQQLIKEAGFVPRQRNQIYEFVD